jgi:hypothetical protein
MHKQFEVTTDFSIGGFATCCVGNFLAFWWMTVTFPGPGPGDGTLLTLGVLAIAYVVGLVSNFCYVAWPKLLMEAPLREEYFRSTARRERGRSGIDYGRNKNVGITMRFPPVFSKRNCYRMDGRGLDGGDGDSLTNNSSGREVHRVGRVFAVTNPTCSLNPLLLNALKPFCRINKDLP